MRFPGKGMSFKDFFKALKAEWADDRVSDTAGSLTYYSFLALFPFLIFLVALASVVISPKDAQQLISQLSRVAPPDVTKILGDRITALGSQSNGGILTLGVIGAFWSASGGIMALMRALNIVYDVKEERPFWKTRGLAILMTLVAGALGLLATVIAVGAPAMAKLIGHHAEVIVGWLRLPVAALLMMLLWAVLYWALPNVEQKFKFITPGSVIGVLVWAVASWGFSLFVSHSASYSRTYGPLAGVIVLLVWMYLTSTMILFGAEVNAIIEHASPDGKRQGAKKMADKGVTPPAEQAALAKNHPPSGQPTGEEGRSDAGRGVPAWQPSLGTTTYARRAEPAEEKKGRFSTTSLLVLLGIAGSVLFPKRRHA